MGKTRKAAVQLWPTNQTSSVMDWIEFQVPPQPDPEAKKSEREEGRVVRANISWLTSRWRCFFGQGCPSALIHSVDPEIGCCQIGTHVGDDEFEKLDELVAELGPDDVDNYDEIHRLRKDGSLRWTRKDKEYVEEGMSRKTRIVDGACIMANRPTGRAGSQGKTGCALHHLATKKGVHFAETKPDICWQVPLAINEEWDDFRLITTITIDATTGHVWGSVDQNLNDYPGFWCVDAPDGFEQTPAHSHELDYDRLTEGMVFRTSEYELRKLLGDEVYEILCERIAEVIKRHGGRRYPMPGEVVNGGRTLIPLTIKNRMKVWEIVGDEDALERSNRPRGIASLGLADEAPVGEVASEQAP